MARDQEGFQRARRPEQKRLREAAILEAARQLALREGIRNISLADIAREVGMHKSALLRYFETREDIFLRLGVAAWQDWVDALGAELGSLEPGDVHGAGEAFGRTLADRPFLCDLFIHSSLNLERNVSAEALFGFKKASLISIRALADALRVPFPELSEEDALEVVGAVTAIAAALSQMFNPTPAMATFYAEHPSIAFPYHDFADTLARFTETMVLGTRAKNAETGQ